MKVRAIKSFGSTRYGHKPAGSVFELPEGVDWLTAGLVEVVDGPVVETAAVEAPEKAVKAKAKPRKRTSTTKRTRKKSE